LAASSLVGAAGANNRKKPNTLMIVADDLGFADIGCYGGEIATPNLDKLAAEGMRFKQFYNCAVCNVSRAAMLTGVHPRFSAGGLLKDNMVTAAEILAPAGYATVLSGKWHLTVPKTRANTPMDRGFEEFYGSMIGAVTHFDPSAPDPHFVNHSGPTQPFVHNRVPIKSVPDGYYSTDAVTDHAIEQIKKFAKSGQPFFLNLAHFAPHYPMQAPPEDIKKYRGKYDDGYLKLRERRHRKMVELGVISPDWELPDPDKKLGNWRYDLKVDSWESLEDKGWETAKMEVYAAMVDRMDQNIGRVMDTLKETGID